jgi:hypothetical protein
LPNEYCPEKITKSYIKGTEPHDVCTIHKKPEPEYVTVKVCETTKLLPNAYCPLIIEMRFEKGTEPISVCIFHTKPEPPPPPPPPPEKPPRLRVENGKIYYRDDGTIPIKLCGVSRWEALWREKKLYYDWGPYSLAWYEEELAKYGINYVRHGAVKDFDFVYQHCQRMKEKGIIVELTVFRNLEEGRLMDLTPENIQMLTELGNVFFDCHNEFMDTREDVFEAKRIAEIISENGGIASGGAWGASTHGEENAALFQQVCPYHRISTVHRQWTKTEIEKSLGYGKPVIRNEYFDRGELGLETVKQIMRETFEAGGQGCQYYGFAMPELQGLVAPDPFDYSEMLAFAGYLIKEIL